MPYLHIYKPLSLNYELSSHNCTPLSRNYALLLHNCKSLVTTNILPYSANIIISYTKIRGITAFAHKKASNTNKKAGYTDKEAGGTNKEATNTNKKAGGRIKIA